MKSNSPEFPSHVLDGLLNKFYGYNHGNVGQRIKSIQEFTELKKTQASSEHVQVTVEKKLV